jgi:hypothetical protein
MTITSTINAIFAIEDATEQDETYIEAFQFLINNGVVWSLQGWYGRAAAGLIEAGECLPAQ